MPIKFDKVGNPYPYEVVSISLDRFKEVFSTIPDKQKRGSLVKSLSRYITDFSQHISPSEWFQWIGGSYVTKKELPNDIDLVNFIDPNTIHISNNKLSVFITKKEADIDSKRAYCIDGYLVPLFHKDDPRHKITLDWAKYWSKWLGHDRNKNPKAVVEVAYK